MKIKKKTLERLVQGSNVISAAGLNASNLNFVLNYVDDTSNASGIATTFLKIAFPVTASIYTYIVMKENYEIQKGEGVSGGRGKRDYVYFIFAGTTAFTSIYAAVQGDIEAAAMSGVVTTSLVAVGVRERLASMYYKLYGKMSDVLNKDPSQLEEYVTPQ